MDAPEIPDDQQRFFAAVDKLKSSRDFRLFDCPYQSPGVELRPYQHIGVAYMLAVPRAILGDHTGLGKTGQSISAYIRLLEKNPNLKCIIVTIKSSLYQWASEIRKFTTGVRAFALDADSFEDSTGARFKKSSKESPAEFRQKAFDQFKEQDAHLLITGYSMLVSENQNLMDIGEEYVVFFDECTQFKTWKPEIKYRDENRLRAQSGKKAYLSVYQAACNVSSRAQRAYGLTATPIKNRLEEAFALYKVIKPDLFPNVTWFRSNFCVYREMMMRGRRIPQLVQYKNLDKFAEIIKPFYIGRSKRDVAPDLPRVITKNVFLEMSPFQSKKYKEALDGLITLGDGDDKTPEKLAQLSYCQAASNTPFLLGFKDEKSSKEDELRRLIDDEFTDQKVIVYTNSLKWIDKLSVEYPNSLKITGSVSGLDRKKAIDTFTESDKHNIIFINKAGIESVNLQAAGVIIFLDTPWSYGDYVQCLTGESRILTPEGYELLESAPLAGTLWTGEKWATYEKHPLQTKGIYEVSFKSGRILRTSTDHSLRSAVNLDWVQVKNLQPGHKVLRDLGFIFDKNKSMEDACDLFYLAGLITGDGSFTRYKRKDGNGGNRFHLSISFSKHQKHIAERAAFLLELRGYSPVLKDLSDVCGAFVVWVHQQEIIDLLAPFDMLNKKFHDKRVPNIVFRANSVQRRAYLLGLYDSDAAKTKNGGWHQNNVNLCRDIQLIHDLEGLDSYLFKTKQAWRVYIKGFPNDFKMSDWYTGKYADTPWEWKCNPKYWVDQLLDKFNSLRKAKRPLWVTNGLSAAKKRRISEDYLKRVAGFFQFPIELWKNCHSKDEQITKFLAWYKDSPHAHSQPSHKQFGGSLRDLRRGRSVSLNRLKELSEFLGVEVPYYRQDEVVGVRFIPEEETTVYKIVVNDPSHQYMADGFIHKNCLGRAQRIGSKHENIIVCHLINEDTIDEYKIQVLLGKKNLVDGIFGKDKENILAVSESDIVQSVMKSMIIGDFGSLREGRKSLREGAE